jgi:hypothetical protein
LTSFPVSANEKHAATTMLHCGDDVLGGDGVLGLLQT